MRPPVLNPLFAAVTTLPGVGPKLEKLYRRLLAMFRHGQRDFVRLDRPEEVGHLSALVEPAGTRLQAASERGEVGEQRHDPILEPGTHRRVAPPACLSSRL